MYSFYYQKSLATFKLFQNSALGSITHLARLPSQILCYSPGSLVSIASPYRVSKYVLNTVNDVKKYLHRGTFKMNPWTTGTCGLSAGVFSILVFP